MPIEGIIFGGRRPAGEAPGTPAGRVCEIAPFPWPCQRVPARPASFPSLWDDWQAQRQKPLWPLEPFWTCNLTELYPFPLVVGLGGGAAALGTRRERNKENAALPSFPW